MQSISIKGSTYSKKNSDLIACFCCIKLLHLIKSPQCCAAYFHWSKSEKKKMMLRNLAAVFKFFFFCSNRLLPQSLEMLVYTIHKLTVDLTYVDMYIQTFMHI